MSKDGKEYRTLILQTVCPCSFHFKVSLPALKCQSHFWSSFSVVFSVTLLVQFPVCGFATFLIVLKATFNGA